MNAVSVFTFTAESATAMQCCFILKVEGSSVATMQCCTKSGGVKCCYKGCTKTSMKNPDLSFFRFPAKDEPRCKVWIINSGNEDNLDFTGKKINWRVLCSSHFKNNAFTNSLRRRLLQNHPLAVPVPWSPDIPQQHLSKVFGYQIKDLIHTCAKCGTGFAKPEDYISHVSKYCTFNPVPLECNLDTSSEENATCSRVSETKATDTPAKSQEVVEVVIKEEVDVDEEDAIIEAVGVEEGDIKEAVGIEEGDIKGEVNVDEDDNFSETSSKDGNQMEFEDSSQHELPSDPFIDSEVASSSTKTEGSSYESRFATEEVRKTEGSSYASRSVTEEVRKTSIGRKRNKPVCIASSQSVTDVLQMANVLALDLEKILSVDILNLQNVNPKQPPVRPPPGSSKNQNLTLQELELKCTQLEIRLRICYLKTMIKNEEDISNLEKEVKKLQIMKEKMEIENKKEEHLQRMENLKLEHLILKSRLDAKSFK